jgi:hypothetical protein
MFGDHFYHAILRKSVAVFGTLFNDIKVVRKDNNGIVKDQQRVPLSYGPKQKFLARLDQQANLDDPKVALKLPRMSFEITNMSYDTATKTSALNTITTDTTQTTRSTVGQMTPYVVDMQLNIIAKNQDDALQIFEQIVPYFQPTYTLSVKFVDGLDKSFDVPITLTAINLQDEYEGEFTTRRSLIYTLDFSMKVKFFGPKAEQGIVTTVSTDVNDINTFGFIEEITVQSSLLSVRATANAFIGDNKVTYFEFTDRGRGYAAAPVVTISPPTTSPERAQVSPVLTNGEITLFNIINPGNFYTGPADITITGIDSGGDFEITATALVRDGRVYAVPLPNKTDIVTIVSTVVDAPTGVAADFAAQVTATLTDDGRLDELVIVDGGGGYIANPTVTIAAPQSDAQVYSVFQGVDNTDDQQIT